MSFFFSHCLEPDNKCKLTCTFNHRGCARPLLNKKKKVKLVSHALVPLDTLGFGTCVQISTLLHWTQAVPKKKKMCKAFVACLYAKYDNIWIHGNYSLELAHFTSHPSLGAKNL